MTTDTYLYLEKEALTEYQAIVKAQLPLERVLAALFSKQAGYKALYQALAENDRTLSDATVLLFIKALMALVPVREKVPAFLIRDETLDPDHNYLKTLSEAFTGSQDDPDKRRYFFGDRFEHTKQLNGQAQEPLYQLYFSLADLIELKARPFWSERKLSVVPTFDQSTPCY